MPSRVEIHPGRHDVPANYCQQKSVPHTLSKLPHEASSRLRQKRTRFTSGGTVDNGVSTSQDLSVHRPRRHVNQNGTRLPKQIKLGSLRPSSPVSPCVATDQIDCVHSRGTVVIDTAITGVEHMEDDNSFSSSVFSEHLVQPELQMVISTAPDNSVDKGKSCRSSILSADNLILTDSENKEADVVLVKDIKSMENLLIHPDSGMETPPLQTTDDAGSSEGEDENDGKDEVLMSASDNMHISNTRPCDSNLPSASHPPVNEEPSDPQNVRFSESDLALLDNSSFSRILPTVESKCEFGHENTSSPGRSRLLSDANSGGVSPKNTVVHLEANDINAESLSSLPPVVEASSNPLMTRVLTRSQTVELSKQPSSPLHCPNSRDSRHPAVPSSVSSAISAVTWLRSHTKNLDKRQSVARGIHGPNRRGSLETTSASSLSSRCRMALTTMSAVNCESRSISEDAPDVSTVSGKIGFCTPGFRSTTTSTVVGLHPSPSALFDQLESVPTANKTKDAASTIHVYPLRSRLRRESMRRQLHAMQSAPKAFDELPTEVLFRITHYLSIQDVFRLQLVCRRLKAIVERYLLLVKRINFSNGLPFAFLPESINDVALKRILSRTPEVTHILGFYPRQITGSYPSDFHSLGNTRLCSNTSLTYAGIVSAFRICPKLRSVELMDVELMGKLVHYLPRIKFHGMFRNRPDSWDCEYAVPLPSEDCRLTASVSQSGFDAQSITESVGTQTDENGSNPLVSNRTMSSCHASAFFCSLTAASAAIATTSKCKPYELLSAADIKRLANKCLSTHRSPPRSDSLPCATPTKTSCHMHSSLPISASVFAHNCAVKLADLATWFEPAGESPLGHGSPSTVPHFLPTRSISFGNSLLPWYDQANLQPVPPNANATGGLDAFRNLAVAPYIQPGLPPIEAELIAAAPIGRDGIPNNQADGAPIALNNHGPVMALAFGAVFISPHLLGQGALGAAAPVFLAQHPGGAADGIVLGNPNPDNRRRVDLLADARHNVVVGVAPQQQIPHHLEERAPNQAGNGAGEERPGAHRPPTTSKTPFATRVRSVVAVDRFGATTLRFLMYQGSLDSHGHEASIHQLQTFT
ncbi:hypothetical protein FGIG_07068 [Fasciola gigantica]|uniref:F-box domain-containing protein n=1 Tax=Fasciola gigantica TaxID=46835 RepID=A0A504YV41_FASGI|nr:hypothetical protein FGIG_07068 [Fasciola gigantica]